MAMASKDALIDAIVRKAAAEGLPEGVIGQVVAEASRVSSLSQEDCDDLTQALHEVCAANSTIPPATDKPDLQTVALRYQWKRAVRKAASPHTIVREADKANFHNEGVDMGWLKTADANAAESFDDEDPQEKRLTSTFASWLDTLISEKGIDLEDTFEFDLNGEFHVMPYGVVIEAMKAAPKHEQAGIKNMIVKIDFANGDVSDYLRHLGKGLAANSASGEMESEGAPDGSTSGVGGFGCDHCKGKGPCDFCGGKKPFGSEMESEGGVHGPNDAPDRAKCEWCDEEGVKRTRPDGSIVYQCWKCMDKVPLDETAQAEPYERPLGSPCRNCAGKGSIGQHECNYCHGKGKTLAPGTSKAEMGTAWEDPDKQTEADLAKIGPNDPPHCDTDCEASGRQCPKCGLETHLVDRTRDAGADNFWDHCPKCGWESGPEMDAKSEEGASEFLPQQHEEHSAESSLDNDDETAIDYKACPHCQKDMAQVRSNGQSTWDCPSCGRKEASSYLDKFDEEFSKVGWMGGAKSLKKAAKEYWCTTCGHALTPEQVTDCYEKGHKVEILDKQADGEPKKYRVDNLEGWERVPGSSADDMHCEKCGKETGGTKLCLDCSPEGTMFKKPDGASMHGPAYREGDDERLWD